MWDFAAYSLESTPIAGSPKWKGSQVLRESNLLEWTWEMDIPIHVDIQDDKCCCCQFPQVETLASHNL